MNKNDGGPAFPAQGVCQTNTETGVPLNPYDGYGWLSEPQDGMSLRDWFAGKVMEGFMSRKETHQFLEDSANIAKACYKFADAMLTEREKQS